MPSGEDPSFDCQVAARVHGRGIEDEAVGWRRPLLPPGASTTRRMGAPGVRPRESDADASLAERLGFRRGESAEITLLRA